MKPQPKEIFSVENFGPIKKVEVEFGDLTVLVGPQATGKSIFLQMYKWKYDALHILNYKRSLGFIWPKNVEEMLRLHFGDGVYSLLSEDSKINGSPIELVVDDGKGISSTFENVIYVPANRDLIFSNNWIRHSNTGFLPFDPYVLRTLSGYMEFFLFKRYDKKGRLSSEQKDSAFWDSNPIYYSKEPLIHIEDQQQKLALEMDGNIVVFNDWSTGQKQYLPIATTIDVLKTYDFEGSYFKEKIVVIEEPELGLHPKAIQSFILQIFTLMERGFRIVLSTHSELILETMWVLNQIVENQQDFDVLVPLFETENRPEFLATFQALRGKSFRTFYFDRQNEFGGAISTEISSLDLFSEDPNMANWGGFMNFKDRANAVVAQVNISK
jgi:hypothetical protein